MGGYQEVGITIDKACNSSSSHTVDVVCGDLNMARWSKSLSDDQAANWHEGTLGELEKRGYIPVADYSDECCFVAVHDSIAQSLHIKGSSWGERTKTLDPAQQDAFHYAFSRASRRQENFARCPLADVVGDQNVDGRPSFGTPPAHTSSH